MEIWALADSEHHINMIMALCIREPNHNYTLIFTRPQRKSISLIGIKNCKLIPAERNYGSDFFRIEKTSRGLIDKLYDRVKPDHFITFYDTHVLFLYIRHTFDIEWKKTGLIEDGLGNYIKVSMPTYYNRYMKACLNRIMGRFTFPTSKFSLGLNPKMPTLYCLFPKTVVAHQHCKIISLGTEYREVILARFPAVKEHENKTPFIVMVPPLLSVRGETVDYIKKYLKKLLNSAGTNVDIVFKLHPKEGKELEEIVKSVCIQRGIKCEFLDTKMPIESYFASFNGFGLCGPPSTAILTVLYLFKSRLIGNIIVIPDKSNPFSQDHLSFLQSFSELKILKI
jgi:hypothetical protein